MSCPRCGAENPGSASFCQACGAALQVAAVQPEPPSPVPPPPGPDKPAWHRPLAIALWLLAAYLLFSAFAGAPSSDQVDACILGGGGEDCHRLPESIGFSISLALASGVVGAVFWRRT
jgi:hypothetical protein